MQTGSKAAPLDGLSFPVWERGAAASGPLKTQW